MLSPGGHPPRRPYVQQAVQPENGDKWLTFGDILQSVDDVLRLHRAGKNTRRRLNTLREQILGEFQAVEGMARYSPKPWGSAGIWNDVPAVTFELVFGFYDRFFSEIAFHLNGKKAEVRVQLRDGAPTPGNRMYSAAYSKTYRFKRQEESIRLLAEHALGMATQNVLHISRSQVDAAQARHASLAELLQPG